MQAGQQIHVSVTLSAISLASPSGLASLQVISCRVPGSVLGLPCITLGNPIYLTQLQILVLLKPKSVIHLCPFTHRPAVTVLVVGHVLPAGMYMYPVELQDDVLTSVRA